MIIEGKWFSEYAPRATKHRPSKRIRQSEVPSLAYVLWEVRPKFERGMTAQLGSGYPFTEESR